MTIPQRRKRLVIAAGLVTAAALVVGVSRVATAADAAKTSRAGRWTWTARMPGAHMETAPLAVDAARAAGLDPGTIRAVVTGGTGQGEARLVSASSRSDGVCFAITAPGQASSFSCRRPTAKEAMVVRVVYGGTSLDSVDHVTVVGVARGDVGTVSVTTADGTLRTLPLNRWRGFSYASDDAESLPTALSAIGKTGSLLERIDLGSFAAPG
jgi:hypothetical protein